MLKHCPILLLVSALQASASALGAPPSDNFANRASLTGPSGQVQDSNLDATKEPQEPNIAGEAGGKSVWWTWVAPEGGRATFYTLTSGIDTLLGVYTGSSLGSLQLVADNDDLDKAAVESLVSFVATKAMEYQISVDGFEADSGRIVLTWFLEPAGFSGPPNDNFGSRARLPDASGQVITTNARGTKESEEPDHAKEPGGR